MCPDSRLLVGTLDKRARNPSRTSSCRQSCTARRARCRCECEWKRASGTAQRSAAQRRLSPEAPCMKEDPAGMAFGRFTRDYIGSNKAWLLPLRRHGRTLTNALRSEMSLSAVPRENLSDIRRSDETERVAAKKTSILCLLCACVRVLM